VGERWASPRHQPPGGPRGGEGWGEGPEGGPGGGYLLDASGVIECYHGRGFDELVHRAHKDFVDQRLPNAVRWNERLGHRFVLRPAALVIDRQAVAKVLPCFPPDR